MSQKLGKRLSLRVLQADYRFTRLQGVTVNTARLSVGAVFRFGR